MNILYIADSASFHTALWTKYFCESGKHNVFLFCDEEKFVNKVNYPNNIQKFQSKSIAHSLFKRLIPIHMRFRHLSQILSVWKYRKEIDAIIDEHDIDIVHCHSLYYGFLSAGFKDKKIPVVFSPQGSDVIEFAQRNWLYKKMAVDAYERADIVTGDSLIKQRSGYPLGAKEEHNHIIQYGVDQSIFYPRPSPVREQLGIADDTLLIFSPRGLEDIYNQEVIIKALALLQKDGVDFKCMFTFPSGTERQQELMQLAKEQGVDDKLVWVGYVDYTQMPDYHNAADLAISVPNTDSSPKSVYEAMSCKCPVIVSELPWAHEFLVNEEDFLIVEEGSEQSLFDGIKRVIEDKDFASKIIEAGYVKAHQRYGYLDNMKNMESIMEAYLAEHTTSNAN